MTTENEEKAMMREALDYMRKDDLDSAELRFNKFLELFPQSPLADNACYNLAHLFLKKGENEKALKQLDELVKSYPQSDSAYLARDERFEVLRLLGQGPSELPDELYRKGKESILKSRWEEALKTFSDLLEKFPESDLVDNVHYNLACIYKHQENKEKTRYHVEMILKHHPDSDAAVYAGDLLDDE